MNNQRIEIVIDGMNLAKSRASDLPWLPVDDTAAVCEAASFFWRCGADAVKIFGAKAWCESSAGLKALAAQGVLFSAPGGLDDDFMLSYADRKGAFIVSNDRFLDHCTQRGYDASWVAFHRVPYMWEPEFAADPNALARVASYQAGAAEPRFGPLHAQGTSNHTNGSGSGGSSSSTSHAGGSSGTSGSITTVGASHINGISGISMTNSTTSSGLGLAVPHLPLNTAAAEGAAAGGGGGSLPAQASATTTGEGGAVNLTMQVPRGVVGRIIGSGGQNVRALEEATGAKIDVQGRIQDCSNADTPATVHLKGSSSAVAAAEAGVTAKVTAFLEQEARFRGNGSYGHSSSDGSASASDSSSPLNGSTSQTNGAAIAPHTHPTAAQSPGLVQHPNLNGSATAFATGNNGAGVPYHGLGSSGVHGGEITDTGMELG